jgi:PIN domain nuclease of toxin-antitoxin system
MRSLLDTHAFLWFISGDNRLSARARNRIEARNAEILLSIASIWELAIKAALGFRFRPQYAALSRSR